MKGSDTQWAPLYIGPIEFSAWFVVKGEGAINSKSFV
jgi:hypothetical protein